MIKLDAICFRRDVRLWGSVAPPRTWERSEGVAWDKDWANWKIELTDDLRFAVVERLGVGPGNPLQGKLFYVPMGSDTVDSFVITPPESPAATADPRANLERLKVNAGLKPMKK
jgi:hypothetical protein